MGNARHLEDAAMALASVELTKITRLRRGMVDYAAVNSEYKNNARAGAVMSDFS